MACCNPENRHQRAATWSDENPDGRWRAFGLDEVPARDKVNLDIFWVRDESLEATANLPEPDVPAAEIVEDLEAAQRHAVSHEESNFRQYLRRRHDGFST